MSENESPPAISSNPEAAAFDDLPPGNHPLEVAARRGFGPLSNAVQDAWHGHAIPCVSCGQLAYREDNECEHCGQDLSEEMLEKMRAHAGPWYVLEHVRPFPGVSLERIVRQIKRGVLTETSIVRGPATQHQWRFAVETPGLCRYFGRCWHCHEEIAPEQHYCPRLPVQPRFGRTHLGRPRTAASAQSNLQSARDCARRCPGPRRYRLATDGSCGSTRALTFERAGRALAGTRYG